MSMPLPSRRSLRELALATGRDQAKARVLSDEVHSVAFAELRQGTNLAPSQASLAGRSVMLVSQTQLPTVLAAIALDGVAKRILLCLPDIAEHDLPAIIAEAAVDAVVCDGSGP